MALKKRGIRLGRAAIGDEAFEQQEKTRVRGGLERRGIVLGPVARGEVKVVGLPQTATGADNALSVEELKAALEAQPTLFDRLYAAEFAREAGPRKGALRALADAELAQPSPRPEVVAKIDLALDPAKVVELAEAELALDTPNEAVLKVLLPVAEAEGEEELVAFIQEALGIEPEGEGE